MVNKSYKCFLPPSFFLVGKVYKKPSHLRGSLDFVFSHAEARTPFPKGIVSPIHPSVLLTMA